MTKCIIELFFLFKNCTNLKLDKRTLIELLTIKKSSTTTYLLINKGALEDNVNAKY